MNWIVYIFMINPKLLRINRSPWIHCSHCAYVWVHLTKPAHWVLFSFQTRTAHLSTRLLTFFSFSLRSTLMWEVEHFWDSIYMVVIIIFIQPDQNYFSSKCDFLTSYAIFTFLIFASSFFLAFSKTSRLCFALSKSVNFLPRFEILCYK